MAKAVKESAVKGEPVFLKLLRDPNRFKKLEDGWVRDSLLGVEWGPSSTEEMTWKEAQKYCAKLEGRLPEVNELQSIVDYRKRVPAINTEIFPDTKSSWYWTATQYADVSGYAWIVSFYFGCVDSFYKDCFGYVWPVRSSQ